MAKTPPPDPAITEQLEKVGIAVLGKAKGEVFEIDGMPMSPVKMPDGTYRNVPLENGGELALKGYKIGKRDGLIFIFEPVDAQEWALVEIATKKIDLILPSFAYSIAEKFWPNGTGPLLAEREKINPLIDAIGKHLIDEVARAKQEEALELEANYRDNPLFGAFA